MLAPACLWQARDKLPGPHSRVLPVTSLSRCQPSVVRNDQAAFGRNSFQSDG